jgi:hypothetical protein
MAFSSKRIYAPDLERDPVGGQSFGPATHARTNLIREMLVGELTSWDDVTRHPGYLPLWYESSAMNGGAQLALRVRRVDDRGYEKSRSAFLSCSASLA